MQVHAIYGPPGTGKTTELLRRVGAAKEAGVQAERVAFVSFTRAAASEALSRLGLRKSSNVSTIHAMAFRSMALRQTQGRLPLAPGGAWPYLTHAVFFLSIFCFLAASVLDLD